VFTPDNMLCSDGNQCTNDVCTPGVGCEFPAGALSCDDNNECTTDTCEAGAGCVNTPMATGGPCYTGPANTENIGECHGGTMTCQPGAGPACQNEVVPVQEVCGGGQDEDCDGFVDEGCGGECVPYETEPCYEGAPETENVGICEAGYRQCYSTGTGWSPCYDQVLPEAADLCGNDLDDDCDGSQNDETCVMPTAQGVWVDWDHGSDDTGDGSFDNPWKTIVKGYQSGKKLVHAKADADGTVYLESLNLGSQNHDITLKGWGPTRPVISGHFHIVHCYDCTIENFELRYPKPGQLEQDPQSTIDAVHNYRNTWRDIVLTAPDGLPAGKDLANCHHGYDNLFIDVVIDDVVFAPSADNGNFGFIDWHDHGSGSQFIRVSLGDNFSAAPGSGPNINITFLSAWGYCDNWPDGVTAVRSCLAAGLDLQSMVPGQTSFTAVKLGCYLITEAPTGFMVANNTFTDIVAGSVNGIVLENYQQFEPLVTSNIIGPFYGEQSTGLQAGFAAMISYSDIFQVATPVGGDAALGVGTISDPPKFANPNFGNYHLGAGSPCIDTGDPALLDADGTATDMGAYGGPYGDW